MLLFKWTFHDILLFEFSAMHSFISCPIQWCKSSCPTFTFSLLQFSAYVSIIFSLCKTNLLYSTFRVFSLSLFTPLTHLYKSRKCNFWVLISMYMKYDMALRLSYPKMKEFLALINLLNIINKSHFQSFIVMQKSSYF